MSWLNIQYESNLRKNDKRDGMKALAVYCLIMCSAFCQGWLYTTNINVIVLNLSQIWIPLILTAGFFLFFYCSKENIRSIIQRVHTNKIIWTHKQSVDSWNNQFCSFFVHTLPCKMGRIWNCIFWCIISRIYRITSCFALLLWYCI